MHPRNSGASLHHFYGKSILIATVKDGRPAEVWSEHNDEHADAIAG